MDEATPAVHAMCLAEVGTDSEGHRWPLYAHAAGGGRHTMVSLALDIVWLKIFGKSRAAFRAAAGFWFLVTAFGLFFFARDLTKLLPAAPGQEAEQRARRAFPWLVLLAALVSPWAFQFSRVAVDPPAGAAFMVLAMVCLLRSYRMVWAARAWSVLAGLCGALAMIAYAPFQAVVPLVLPLLGGCLLALDRQWSLRWKFVRRLIVAGVVGLACLVPTLQMLSRGQIGQRMNNVAIWRPDWVSEHAGATPRWIFLSETFLDNLLVHLRPSFLFFQGDACLRNSPQISGQLSPLDMLALALAAGLVCLALHRLVRGRLYMPGLPGTMPSTSSRLLLAIALGAAAGWLLALVPAALTFEAIPHAVRALGAWPFVALLSGAVLAWGWSHLKWLPPVLAVVVLGHSLHYLPAYFHAYDNVANHWFMRDMTDVLERERKATPSKTVQQIVSEHLGYSYFYDEVPRYYLMSEGNLGCVKARELVHQWRERERGR